MCIQLKHDIQSAMQGKPSPPPGQCCQLCGLLLGVIPPFFSPCLQIVVVWNNVNKAPPSGKQKVFLMCHNINNVKKCWPQVSPKSSEPQRLLIKKVTRVVNGMS